MDTKRTARLPALGAAAIAFATLVGPAAARELAGFDSDEYWSVTPTDLIHQSREHVEVPTAGGPPLKLPLVVLPGTRYEAAVTNVLGTHANPRYPHLPMTGPERLLTVAVGPRDVAPGSKARDKVQLTFTDKNFARDLHVDIERPEPRYVAFDIRFHPTYELSRDSHFVIHFQALQLGMGEAVRRGTGGPPFSIRVQGTTPNRPDPFAPIDLRLERRWWDGTTRDVHEAVLPGDGLDALRRGRWYRIVLELVPGYDEGSVAVWHWDLAEGYDRCDAPWQEWLAPWGYRPPVSGDPETDRRRRALQFGVGIYRRASDTAQRLDLKNIRYGTTYDDVVPGAPC
jgi:hypothetical protein